MALERPLVQGPMCGNPAGQALAACPVCEDALAAAAGPLHLPGPFTTPSALEDEHAALREQAQFARQVLADAPARAPPQA